MSERFAFLNEQCYPKNPKWENSISRIKPLFMKPDDVRTEFSRDYNRILHSNAYRRLKHKTQVFFATRNDHICTRIEHVTHVSSISYSIAQYFGLNTELVMAIATGHDLGHAPFGHAGEMELSKILKNETGGMFWHENNSLRFADFIETLADPENNERNLNLTYAVRDGIICHCGEVDEKGAMPRDEFIDLHSIDRPNQVLPYTWEGCVVKIADKIAYLGRDIEDAIKLGILSVHELEKLNSILKKYKISKKGVSNSFLINHFVMDLCRTSSPEIGIMLSQKYRELIDEIKKFNYENIYFHKRIENYKKYIALVINSLFDTLYSFYSDINDLKSLMKNQGRHYPKLAKHFYDWFKEYSESKNGETPLYRKDCRNDFVRAVIDFISGMTDQYALDSYSELISF